jgi:4-hydroxy-2-oxoglutarate aldolase
MLVHSVFGYSEKPRRPLLPMAKEQGELLMAKDSIRAVLEEEASYKEAI